MKKNKQPKPVVEQKVKAIVLDDYKKSILNVVMFVLVISVFVPFLVFYIFKTSGPIVLQSADADNIYQTFISSYNESEYESAKFSYSYKDVGEEEITEVYNFNLGLLTSREYIVVANTQTTKTVYRKIKVEDRAIIESFVPEVVSYSAPQFLEYVNITTNCLVENYEKLNTETDFTFVDYAFNTQSITANGASIKNVTSNLRGNSEIESGNAVIDFNIFGMDYKYLKTTFEDEGNNIIVFEGDKLSKVTLESGKEYVFSYNYTVSI